MEVTLVADREMIGLFLEEIEKRYGWNVRMEEESILVDVAGREVCVPLDKIMVTVDDVLFEEENGEDIKVMVLCESVKFYVAEVVERVMNEVYGFVDRECIMSFANSASVNVFRKIIYGGDKNGST